MNSSARSWADGSIWAQPALLLASLRDRLAGRAGPGEARLERSGGTLRVRGPLDHQLVAAFKAQVLALCEGEGGPCALELSGVTAWDSEGLAALVYALDVAERNGRSLTLVAPSAPLREMIERAQLHHLFAIRDR